MPPCSLPSATAAGRRKIKTFVTSQRAGPEVTDAINSARPRLTLGRCYSRWIMTAAWRQFFPCIDKYVSVHRRKTTTILSQHILYRTLSAYNRLWPTIGRQGQLPTYGSHCSRFHPKIGSLSIASSPTVTMSYVISFLSTVTGDTTLLSAIHETSPATFYSPYLTHWQKLPTSHASNGLVLIYNQTSNISTH